MIDRFYIGAFDQESGLQTDVKPYLIPDQAFARLDDAYVFRARVKKRFGSRWLDNSSLGTRLRIKLGSQTDGSGNVSTTVPLKNSGALIASIEVGQMFSIGTATFTVTVAAAGSNDLLRSDGVVATATINTTTGALVINGASANSDVYYYPALPVMALPSFNSTKTNEEPTYAFDTRFAYHRVDGGWDRLSTEATTGAAYWSGSNTQFHWAENYSAANPYENVLYVSNNNPDEYHATDHPGYMRYYDTNTGWNYITPDIGSSQVIQAARILVVFKNRLVALATTEGTVGGAGNVYNSRARASAPIDPTSASAWLLPPSGQGFASDAPTSEKITGVTFVKDRLIVGFEKSTWELAYTGNQINPFVWQQINTELGVESTFSMVPFDKVAIGVGNLGIHACNGSNVERIDNKIPQAVFNIHNDDDGPKRVYGIRDYTVELLYWTFPDDEANSTFIYPNRVMMYNYRNRTWGFYKNSFTCFGYYQAVEGDEQEDGVSWDDSSVTWDDDASWGGVTASVESSPKIRQVIAGNQQGWTVLCSPGQNSDHATRYITNLTYADEVVTVTCIDHNFRPGDYVYISGIESSSTLKDSLNGKIFAVTDTDISATQFKFIYDGSTALAGTYRGSGLLAAVANPTIWTKQYNFYAQEGRNVAINKVNFLLKRTAAGEFTVDYNVNANDTSLLTGSNPNNTNVNMGTNIVETSAYTDDDIEQNANRVWHPIYLFADGAVIQLKLSLSDAQMRNASIRLQGFTLYGMCFEAMRSSWRMQ